MRVPELLLVDSDPAVLSNLAEQLRQQGVEVVTASTVEEARRALADGPAMIVSEIDVPGDAGFSLLRELRAEPLTRNVPFFFLSTRDETAYRLLARKAGADDYLVKPLKAEDLAALSRLFAHGRCDDGSVEGDLAEVPLFFLLRALLAGGRSGALRIPEVEGLVSFRAGRVVHAETEGVRGEGALSRLLLLSEGTVVLKFGPQLREATLDLGLRELGAGEVKPSSHYDRALASVGGLDARLCLDYAALARNLAALPDALNAFLRLFDGKRTLSAVVADSGFDAVTAVEVTARLRSIGVLVQARDTRLPPTDVHLFEPREDEARVAMEQLFPEPPPAVADALPASAPAEVRDWFEDAEARALLVSELLAAGDGGWSELPVGEAGLELEAFEPPAPESVAEVVRKDQSRPAGASALPIPGWAFLAADEATRAVMLDVKPAVPAMAPAEAQVVTAALRAAPTATLGDDDDEDTVTFVATQRKATRTLAIVAAVALVLGGVGLVAFSGGAPAPELAPAPAPAAAAPVAPVVVVAPPAVEAIIPPAEAPAPVAAAPEIDPSFVPAPLAAPAPAAKDEIEVPPALDDTHAQELLAAGKKLFDAGKAKAAVKKLDEAAGLLPNSTEVWTLLALATFDAGDLDGAESAANHALSIDDKTERAVLVRAMVFQTRQDVAKAKAEYERYLALAPNGANAGEVKSILAELK